MDEPDQPILVAAHVKYRQIAHEISGAEVRLQLDGVPPPRRPHGVCPMLERFDGFRKPRPKFPNPPFTDNPHVPKFPYVELEGQVPIRVPYNRTSKAMPIAVTDLPARFDPPRKFWTRTEFDEI